MTLSSFRLQDLNLSQGELFDSMESALEADAGHALAEAFPSEHVIEVASPSKKPEREDSNSS